MERGNVIGGHDEQGVVGVVDALVHEQLEAEGLDVSFEEAVHSDDDGAEAGKFVEDTEAGVLAWGRTWEKEILDAMSADRRLWASFSLARLTRFTTPRIASAALRAPSSEGLVVFETASSPVASRVVPRRSSLF